MGLFRRLNEKSKGSDADQARLADLRRRLEGGQLSAAELGELDLQGFKIPIFGTTSDGKIPSGDNSVTSTVDLVKSAKALAAKRATLQLGPKSTQVASRRRRITPDIFRSTLGTAKELLGKGA